MTFSSLTDWLGWLEKSHPIEIDLGLERIRQVAERLQLLPLSAKVITVAGTNGKGSCVTACTGLLRAANWSVGTYTSPHLLNYNERIQLNGKPVDDVLICNAFEQIAAAAAEISLTYFEYGTLAALVIFQQAKVDAVVLEVGLGGRLDAVNIVDADIAIITSIALDHQDWLGDTRELIGREKAGILREERVFICADENPPESICEMARSLNTQSYFIGRDFSFEFLAPHWHWQGFQLDRQPVHLNNLRAPHLPLPSMAAALQAVFLLGVQLTPQTIEHSLLHLQLPGRFQKIVYQSREFILDVAHNPAATHYFAERLRAEPVHGKTHAMVAMMADKDRVGSLANMVHCVDQWFLLDLAAIPRAATPAILLADLQELNQSTDQAGPVDKLMAQLLSKSAEHDRVVVFGSFYTVAAVLSYLDKHAPDVRGIQ